MHFFAVGYYLTVIIIVGPSPNQEFCLKAAPINSSDLTFQQVVIELSRNVYTALGLLFQKLPAIKLT